MAFSKAHLYSPDLQLPARYAKALAHPERLAILQMLKDQGPMCAGDIWKKSILSRPVVSQHLKILREVNLVEWEDKCPYIIYRINRESIAIAHMVLHSAIVKMEGTKSPGLDNL